jgi:hypothetical protein
VSTQQSTIGQFVTTAQKQHRDRLFSKQGPDTELGWWEKTSAQTLKFLGLVNSPIPSTIFLAGAGTVMLAGDLLVRGHLIIKEISSAGLSTLQRRLVARPPGSICIAARSMH